MSLNLENRIKDAALLQLACRLKAAATALKHRLSADGLEKIHLKIAFSKNRTSSIEMSGPGLLAAEHGRDARPGKGPISQAVAAILANGKGRSDDE